MGCHTWPYRKIALTDEQVQEIKTEALKNVNKYLNSTDETLSADYDKVDKELFDKFGVHLDCTLEEFGKGVKWWKDCIINHHIKERFENNDFTGVSNFVDMSKYNVEEKDRFIGVLFYKGNWYEPITKYTDMFRISGYPEDKFIDPYELIKWLKTRDVYRYEGNESINGVDEVLEKKIIDAFNETEGLLFEFG